MRLFNYEQQHSDLNFLTLNMNMNILKIINSPPQDMMT